MRLKDRIRETTKRKARKIPRKSKLKDDPVRLSMTAKERNLKFVEVYKRTGDIVQATTEAHISAGEAKLLIATHPELREDITDLLNRLGATPERIVQEMMRIAFSNPRQMLDDNGNLLPMQQWPEDLTRAISGMDVTRRIYRGEDFEEEEITHKPRFWDKNVQLKELARMQQIAGAEVQRVGNVPGERLKMDGGETREEIMLSLLALVKPKADPEDKDEEGK